MNPSFNLVLSVFLIVNAQPTDIELASHEMPNIIDHYQINLHKENVKFQNKDFRLLNNNGLLYLESLSDKHKCVTVRVHNDTAMTFHDQVSPNSKLYISLPRDIIASRELYISLDFTHEEKILNRDYLLKINVF